MVNYVKNELRMQGWLFLGPAGGCFLPGWWFTGGLGMGLTGDRVIVRAAVQQDGKGFEWPPRRWRVAAMSSWRRSTRMGKTWNELRKKWRVTAGLPWRRSRSMGRPWNGPRRRWGGTVISSGRRPSRMGRACADWVGALKCFSEETKEGREINVYIVGYSCIMPRSGESCVVYSDEIGPSSDRFLVDQQGNLFQYRKLTSWSGYNGGPPPPVSWLRKAVMCIRWLSPSENLIF